MQTKKTTRKPTAKKNSSNRNKEITGIVIIALGIFLFACMLLHSTGFLGTFIRPIMLGINGLAAFIVPIILCIFGVALIMLDKKSIRYSKILLLSLMYILSICVIHMIFLKDLDTNSYIEFIKSSYALGISIKGMGAFAAIITYPFYRMIGTIGSFLIYLVALVICIIIYGNLSIKKISEDAAAGYQTLRQRREEKKEEKRLAKEAKLYNERIDAQQKENPIQDILEKDYSFLGNNEIPGNSIVNTLDDFDDNVEDRVIEEIDNPKTAKFQEPLAQKIEEPIKKDVINQVPVSDSAIKKSAVQTDSEPTTKGDKLISVNDVSKYKPAFNMRADSGFLHLLKQPDTTSKGKDKKELEIKAAALEQALESFGVDAKVVNITCGPTITRFEIQLAYGVKTNKILSLTNDIKMALAAKDVRIEAPIPGKNAVGIEIPNDTVRTVYLREVLESESFMNSKSKLATALGIDIDGNSIVADLEKMPHLMIAGTTGSGKSVCINNLILSYLYNATPQEVKMIMVDPKMVELASYNDIPHLLIPVVTDSKKAAGALRWALNEMEKRYLQFSKIGVRQLSTYNANVDNVDEKLPSVVVIVDELADLMMVAAQEVEEIICRIAQKGRAAGIHLVLATQRPSVNVITGVIKANIPSRIAFQVFSQIDSRTILDMAGAERLLGKGDMLYHPNGASSPIRLQGAFVSEQEVREITDYIKEHNEAEYNEEIVEAIEKSSTDPNILEGGTTEYDELLPSAVKVFLERKEASISLLQRKMRIGYARAARIVDEMEEMGIVSPPDGSRPRDVLINTDDYNRMFGDN